MTGAGETMRPIDILIATEIILLLYIMTNIY